MRKKSVLLEESGLEEDPVCVENHFQLGLRSTT